MCRGLFQWSCNVVQHTPSSTQDKSAQRREISSNVNAVRIWMTSKILAGKSSLLNQDPGIFGRILQHCEIGYFSTIWHTSPEKKWSDFYANFSIKYPRTKKSSLNFGSHPDLTLLLLCELDAMIVTSARDVMFYPAFCLSVCLSVCMLSTLRKNCWSDMWTRKNWLKFESHLDPNA